MKPVNHYDKLVSQISATLDKQSIGRQFGFLVVPVELADDRNNQSVGYGWQVIFTLRNPSRIGSGLMTLPVVIKQLALPDNMVTALVGEAIAHLQGEIDRDNGLPTGEAKLIAGGPTMPVRPPNVPPPGLRRSAGLPGKG